MGVHCSLSTEFSFLSKQHLSFSLKMWRDWWKKSYLGRVPVCQAVQTWSILGSSMPLAIFVLACSVFLFVFAATLVSFDFHFDLNFDIKFASKQAFSKALLPLFRMIFCWGCCIDKSDRFKVEMERSHSLHCWESTTRTNRTPIDSTTKSCAVDGMSYIIIYGS